MTISARHRTSSTVNSPPPLTVIHIFQDVDLRRGVVPSQAAPDRQGQGDVEALVSLVQGVVDDHHAALLLPLTLVEAKDAAVLLRAGDVIRVGQDGGGDCPRGGTFEREGQGEDSETHFLKCLSKACVREKAPRSPP